MSLVGNLEDLGLGDIFQIIFLSRRSGILSIKGRTVEGSIFFKNGLVVAATSSSMRYDLGELLVRKGVVNANQRNELLIAFQTAPGDADLPTVLLRRFRLSRGEMEKAIEEGLQEIVLSLFILEGSFDFELKDVDHEIGVMKRSLSIVAEPGLNPQFLAMEGSRLLDEGRHIPPKKVGPEVPAPESVQRIETPPVITPPIKIKEEPPGEQGFSLQDVKAELGLMDEEVSIPAVVSSPGLQLLRSMIFELQSPHSNSEITLLILRFASEIMNRAVLFIVKRDTVEGLGQFGVVLNGADPNRRIRGIKIPLHEPSIFKEVVEKGMVIKGRLADTPWHNYLIKELGGYWPVEVFLAPITVTGKVAAILYGDNTPEPKPIEGTDALEIFLIQAGMAMEKALLERRLKIHGIQGSNS